MVPTTLQIAAALIFAFAVLHTFSVKWFEALGHRFPSHAGLFHLLAEVEAVFGIWAAALFAAYWIIEGGNSAIAYVDQRNYTEPLFVFAIMVVAASKPILELVLSVITLIAKLAPKKSQNVAFFFATIALLPLLGSFITEPAAMTLAALVLRDRFFAHGLPERFMYATVGVLFVNVSIGGTLTNFAAPPVLMVANTWGWSTAFMASTFGVKAAIAVFINASALTFYYFQTIKKVPVEAYGQTAERVPYLVQGLHLAFLAWIVSFAHHPPLFLGGLLFFLGFAMAYPAWQNRLMLREGLMVAFFLAGLVILGGLQQWWLKPLLTSMNEIQVFWGATALTAITDNAALTYLGSLVDGLNPEFKYALVAGAVTGGGLTVIANAPNPAGYAILRHSFEDQSIGAGGLFLSALLPTLVAAAAFSLF